MACFPPGILKWLPEGITNLFGKDNGVSTGSKIEYDEKPRAPVHENEVSEGYDANLYAAYDKESEIAASSAPPDTNELALVLYTDIATRTSQSPPPYDKDKLMALRAREACRLEERRKEIQRLALEYQEDIHFTRTTYRNKLEEFVVSTVYNQLDHAAFRAEIDEPD